MSNNPIQSFAAPAFPDGKHKSFTAVIVLCLLAAAFGWHASTAVASTAAGCQPNITVTSTDDSGPGTLRQAILDVCTGGVIDFDLLWPVTITLTSGQLTVAKAMRIEGPGANQLSISNSLPFTRVLQNDGEGLFLSGMTIRDGSTPENTGDGGGILNTGVLTITHAVIRDNRADSILGDVNGGGIANVGGMVTISHSTIMGNTAGGGGGLANKTGVTTLINCTFIGNYAVDGGAILNEGGAVTINNSTLLSNRSVLGGGGIRNSDGATLALNYSAITNNVTGAEWGLGGGIQNAESAVTVYHSTLSNNSAASGGGIFSYDGMLTIENTTLSSNEVFYLGGGLYIDDGYVTIDHTTLADNVADTANNIYLSLVNSFTVNNSIITSNNEGANCDGSQSQITSLGYNLSDDSSCHLIEPTDLQNTDPLLGPLADNGGATLTHGLLPGSPAIDNGDDAACPARDQRGVSRPQGAGCDRGALEAVDITSRLDYAYVMNDGSTGQGRYTLFTDGSFLDEASGGGSWDAPAPDKLWLAYDAGFACDALLLGSVLPPDQVRGLRLCRDGSAARGFWQGDILAETDWLWSQK